MSLELFLYFFPLAAVIALVSSGTRHESFEAILVGAGKTFLWLVLGLTAFSVVLQVSLEIPVVFYTLLVLLISLLVFYTLKELLPWASKGAEKPPAAPPAGGGI